MLEKLRMTISRWKAEEPSTVSEAVRLVLAAVVGTAWLTIPEPVANAAVSVGALVVSAVLTWWTRRKVTPVSRIDGCCFGCRS